MRDEVRKHFKQNSFYFGIAAFWGNKSLSGTRKLISWEELQLFYAQLKVQKNNYFCALCQTYFPNY